MPGLTSIREFDLPKDTNDAYGMLRDMDANTYGRYLLYVQSLWLAGIKLEASPVGSGCWHAIGEFNPNTRQVWSYPNKVQDGLIAYRVKAEPAKVPWTRETVPNGLAWVRTRDDKRSKPKASAVICVDNAWLVVSYGTIYYAELADHYEWSESFNGPWKECVTIES